MMAWLRSGCEHEASGTQSRSRNRRPEENWVISLDYRTRSHPAFVRDDAGQVVAVETVARQQRTRGEPLAEPEVRQR